MELLFVILTDNDSPLWGGPYGIYRQQSNDEKPANIPMGPKETVMFVSQTSRKSSTQMRVEDATEGWLARSSDGFIGVAYHDGWLDPWDGTRLLPFVPFHHEDYDPVFKNCLLPFSRAHISFHDAWRLMGQTGRIIESLKAELLTPFIPYHLFAQSEPSSSVDPEWQHTFAEAEERVRRAEGAHTLTKLLSFAPLDSDEAQQKLAQLFGYLTGTIVGGPIPKESVLELQELIDKFTEGLDSLFENSDTEIKPDPVAAFRHSCDNAVNYLSPPLCAVISPAQTKETLNDAIEDLIGFGENFVSLRIGLFQQAKDFFDKQFLVETEAALTDASRVYDRLRNNLNAGPTDRVSDDLREGIRCLDSSFRQILDLLRQKK